MLKLSAKIHQGWWNIIGGFVLPGALHYVMLGIVGLRSENAFTLGWLVIGSFFVQVIGLAFIVRGIIILVRARAEQKDPNSVAAKLTRSRPSLAWIGYFFTMIVLTGIAALHWHDQVSEVDHYYTYMVLGFVVLIVIGSILMGFVKKTPWHVVLIGEPNMLPHDEREKSLHNQASQYTLVTLSIAVLLLLASFSFFGTPSKLSIVYLGPAILFSIRGTLNFFNWRLGYR